MAITYQGSEKICSNCLNYKVGKCYLPYNGPGGAATLWSNTCKNFNSDNFENMLNWERVKAGFGYTIDEKGSLVFIHKLPDYSQNGEQYSIMYYFKNTYRGTFLDIGANDGKTLSNTYALAHLGWNGVMVEPSKLCFERLQELHPNRNEIELFNVAISDSNGIVDFFESGSHIGSDDHSIISTLKRSEKRRWAKAGNKFTKTKTEAITIQELLARSKHKTFDFISIDAEGLDFEILSQMDLSAIQCKMLCVETNSKDDDKYKEYCSYFGLTPYWKSMENFIFALQ